MNAFEQIGREEGFEPKPYKDTLGYWTLGKGLKLDLHGLDQEEFVYLLEHKLIDIEITEEGAEHLLEKRVMKIIDALKAALPWFVNLSQPRQAVLTGMAYQMGLGEAKKGTGLLGFRQTLACIQTGNFLGAKASMLNSLWAKQTPARAKKMAEQLLTDQWL